MVARRSPPRVVASARDMVPREAVTVLGSLQAPSTSATAMGTIGVSVSRISVQSGMERRRSRRSWLGDAGRADLARRQAEPDIQRAGHLDARRRREPVLQGGVTMEIKRAGSQPSGKGPTDWFTGTVRIDPLFQTSAPARVAGAAVTFEPGARTAWHTHPLGQTLIVTAGVGRAQREGGPIEEIHPGDVIWFPPGEKHWHGAAPTTAMTHIAIQEALDGKVVDWMEKVSDQQYRRALGAAT